MDGEFWSSRLIGPGHGLAENNQPCYTKSSKNKGSYEQKQSKKTPAWYF